MQDGRTNLRRVRLAAAVPNAQPAARDLLRPEIVDREITEKQGSLALLPPPWPLPGKILNRRQQRKQSSGLEPSLLPRSLLLQPGACGLAGVVAATPIASTGTLQDGSLFGRQALESHLLQTHQDVIDLGVLEVLPLATLAIERLALLFVQRLDQYHGRVILFLPVTREPLLSSGSKSSDPKSFNIPGSNVCLLPYQRITERHANGNQAGSDAPTVTSLSHNANIPVLTEAPRARCATATDAVARSTNGQSSARRSWAASQWPIGSRFSSNRTALTHTQSSKNKWSNVPP